MYKKEKTSAGRAALLFLLCEMRRYRRYSALLPCLACFLQVAQSFLLILLPKLVLDGVQRGSQALFSRTAAAGLGLTAVSLLNLVVHNEIAKCSQTFLYRRLTAMWEQKTIRLDYKIFLSGQGKIRMEKARQAISSPNQGVVELLGKEAALLEAAAGLAVCCKIVGRLHPLILVLLLLLFLLQLAWGLRAERKKHGLKEERARADRRLNYIAYGTKGMREGKDIRIYSMAPMLKEITREVIQEKCRVEAAVQKYQFSHLAADASMILVRDSASYLFLIRQYMVSELSVGDFSFYFAAITGVGLWLTKLSKGVSGFREAAHYAQDFYEFMELPEDEGTEHAKIPGEAALSFELKHVSFSYSIQSKEGEKRIPVIRNMNLSVSAGERLAIVGVNGAGKSTLIKLLCGMVTPDEGEILVNGTDSRRFRKTDYYKLFSAVFQKSQLLPVTIGENIAMGATMDRERLWNCIRLAGLEEKVKSLPHGEDTCLGKGVSEDGVELSGGQEQRLLLARALYKNAPVLLLDEPTAALDPLSERDIYQKYHLLTEGRTALFVSHRLASTRFCDRILFMGQGEILESGTHEELMALGGGYADMFRVQSKYYEEGADFA